MTNISQNTKVSEPLRNMEWVKKLWIGRYRIIISIGVSTIIGFAIAFGTIREYTSWTTMVPQVSKPGANLGNISTLAAMAGFNLNLNNEDELSPSIYPQIIGSVPFQLELMNTPFFFSDLNKSITLYTYFTEYSKKGFSKKIENIFSKKKKNKTTFIYTDTLFIPSLKPIYITRDQEKVRKLIEKRVTLNVDLKNGFLTLRSTFRDPVLAAQVAGYSCELLQRYITRFKINKATDQLLFIEERYLEKKNEFLTAQEKLALFLDQNRNLSSAVAAAEEERLRGEYNIALSVYNELAKQLEQSKIQVKEDTPVFSTIQPATIPIKPSKPQKALIVTVWFFLGLLFGIGLVFVKPYLKQFSLQIADNKQ